MNILYVYYEENHGCQKRSIKIEEEMLNKIAYIVDYEGRSANSQVLVLIRKSIKTFESTGGAIDAISRLRQT